MLLGCPLFRLVQPIGVFPPPLPSDDVVLRAVAPLQLLSAQQPAVFVVLLLLVLPYLPWSLSNSGVVEVADYVLFEKESVSKC